MITIALSKGRIFEETIPLLKAAGIEVMEDPDTSRKLILTTNQPDVRVLVSANRRRCAISLTRLSRRWGEADLGELASHRIRLSACAKSLADR